MAFYSGFGNDWEFQKQNSSIFASPLFVTRFTREFLEKKAFSRNSEIAVVRFLRLRNISSYAGRTVYLWARYSSIVTKAEAVLGFDSIGIK
jgi:hypothetical protein